MALNESVSEGGSDTLEEIFGTEQDDEVDDEDAADEADTGPSPAAGKPGVRARAGGGDEE